VSGSSPDALRRAIALEDTARFQAIPGIGKEDRGARRAGAEGAPRLGQGTQGATLAPRRIWSPVTRSSSGYSLAEARRRLPAGSGRAPEERVREALPEAA
jgi:hypothetical protein